MIKEKHNCHSFPSEQRFINAIQDLGCEPYLNDLPPSAFYLHSKLKLLPFCWNVGVVPKHNNYCTILVLPSDEAMLEETSLNQLRPLFKHCSKAAVHWFLQKNDLSWVAYFFGGCLWQSFSCFKYMEQYTTFAGTADRPQTTYVTCMELAFSDLCIIDVVGYL